MSWLTHHANGPTPDTGPATPQEAGHTQAEASLYDAKPDEVLIALRAATHQMLRAHDQFMHHLSKLSRPAQLETVVLNPGNNGQYVWESRERAEDPVLSLGVLNPNAVTIYFSGVGSAAANMRSLSCPPNCLIVVPIQAQMIEVAATPTDLGASTAVVFLFRFFTVQPAYLGKGA